MLSSNNILSPASGRPIAVPTLDMVTGLYYLCLEKDGAPGEGRVFGSAAEAMMAYDRGELGLQAKISIRLKGVVPPVGWTAPEDYEPGAPYRLETTLGRALFNETLPPDY